MSTQCILLVDDNDDDAELTARAFLDARITNPIVRARDGIDALDLLLGRGTKDGGERIGTPAIILLDLNLPRLSGLDLLKAIRTTESIRHIPVVVLTSSIEDKDRLAAYREYANSYVRKPLDHQEFVAVSRQLGFYWLMLNQPAPNSR